MVFSCIRMYRLLNLPHPHPVPPFVCEEGKSLVCGLVPMSIILRSRNGPGDEANALTLREMRCRISYLALRHSAKCTPDKHLCSIIIGTNLQTQLPGTKHKFECYSIVARFSPGVKASYMYRTTMPRCALLKLS